MSHKLTSRQWNQEDLQSIASFHNQMAPGYTFPREFGPLFFVNQLVEDVNGQIVAAAAVKLVGEGFLWVNPSVSRLDRTRAIALLNKTCAETAKTAGLEEVSCWVPPKIAACFERLMAKLGWKQAVWPNWGRVL